MSRSLYEKSIGKECVVSLMTKTYAKASGEVGVCMATRGPGATNLSIGLHTAMQDSTPVVALIGQVERPFKGKEAFQEIDFAAYFSHLCKWAVEIDDAERIPEILHRAFYIARSGRPGPVVVSRSTRLNSSHVASSYAVFCLKKKKKAHTLHDWSRVTASARDEVN